jgi:peroxiredoxin Q/BCP
MALSIGTTAPDFTLNAPKGVSFHLKEVLASKPVLLFFYPKDFTVGCTREACSFRDQYGFFRDKNIEVVGISHDDHISHQKFSEKYNLPYTLLSDNKKQVSKAYQALYPFGLMTKRITYLIGQDGQIKAVFDSMLNADGHIQYMMKQIENRVL